MHRFSGLSRIIWKEYRSQRSVWLALLFGTALLQSMAFEPGDLWPVRLPTAYPFIVALVVSICFSVTSVAILFAGEREEETDQWLLQLPIPPARLLAAKLSAALMALALFLLATLLAAGAVVLLVNRPTSEIMADLPALLRTMIGTFLWALFFSLLTRGVLKTLILTTVAELTTIAIAGISNREFDHRIYFGILGGVLIADIWLARRWASGWHVPSAGRMSRLKWGSDPTSVRKPAWLSRVVNAGAPAVRMSGALLWREARGAGRFLLVWFAAGVFFVDIQLRFLEPRLPTHLMYLTVTPVMCGLMTCLGDQRRGTIRFLAERGVSPSAVWLHKQFVWLGVALLLVSLFVCWDVVTADRMQPRDPSRPETVPWLLHEMASLPAQSPAMDGTERTDPLRTWSLASSLVLSLFAVGQLASFWIRRTALIGAAAFFMALTTLIWHGFAAMVDLPLLWATWPVAVLFLSATWATRGSWMREQQGLKIRAVRTGWVVMTCLLLLAGARHLRATQIPESSFRWHGTIPPSHDRDLSEQSQRLFSDLRLATMPVSGESPTSEQLDLRFAQAAASVRAFNAELTNSNSVSTARLSPEVMTEPHPGIERIGRVMSLSASRHMHDGELDAAWDDILAGLRVSEFLSTQGVAWSDWQACLAARDGLYAAARDWGQHPGATADQFNRALGDLQQLAVADWLAGSMLENRYLLYRQLFEGSGPLWERLQREGQIDFGDLTLTKSTLNWSAWTGERERMIRLMTLLTARSARRLHPEAYATSPVWTDPEFPPDSQIAGWAATTSFQGGDFTGDLWTDAAGRSTIDQQFLRVLALERGTMLVLAAHAHRREHGVFPSQLADLTRVFGDELPRDPYTGGDFGYASTGLDAPVVPLGGREIPAEQPLLWSAGLNRAVLAYHVGPIEVHERTIPGDRYVARPLMWGSISPPASALLTPDGGRGDLRRVRFVILGQEPPQWSANPPGEVDNEN